MNIEALQQRIRLGEDSTLELKRVEVSPAGKVTEPHADGIADELMAMANAAGGMLVLGIDDKTRAVTGIPLAQMDQVEAWVTAICRPVYEQVGDLELCLTIFATAPPARAGASEDEGSTA